MAISLCNDNRIKSNASIPSKIETIATRTIGITCPQCSSKNYNRNGRTNHRQRYKCKECNRTFGDTHNTPLFRIQKNHLVPQYLRLLKEGLTIRAAAKETGLSIKTAFQWRHKFLTSLHKNENGPIKGLTSISIIQIPFSAKGNRTKLGKHPKKSETLLIIAENKPAIIKVMPDNCDVTQITKHLNKMTLEGATTYIKTKKLTSALKHTDNDKKTIEDKTLRKYILENHREMEIRLKDWLSKFRGVATKYLDQYWAWFCQNEMLIVVKNIEQQYKTNCLGSRNSALYNQLREKYK